MTFQAAELTPNGYLVTEHKSGEAFFDVNGNLRRPDGRIAITSDGAVVSVSGINTSHRTLEPRTGDWAVAASDSNATVPSAGAGTTTLNADTFGPEFQAMEIVLYAAGARTLAAGSGVTLIVLGGGAASVSTKGSALVVTRGSTANEFIVAKLVA